MPILLTFLALASHGSEAGSPSLLALRLVAEQIGIGALIGVGLTLAAVWGLRITSRRGWVVDPWLGIPVVALAVGCFALSQLAHGSGFIACFTGGLTFGALSGEHKHAVLEGAEGTGEVFSLVTWVVFGAAVVSQHPEWRDWRVFLYALLSLTVVRMLPAFVAVRGLGLSTDARLFLGWFGPRGLASVVFAVIVVQELELADERFVAVTVTTVVLSILAHGLSANPLAAALGARAKSGSGGAD